MKIILATMRLVSEPDNTLTRPGFDKRFPQTRQDKWKLLFFNPGDVIEDELNQIIYNDCQGDLHTDLGSGFDAVEAFTTAVWRRVGNLHAGTAVPIRAMDGNGTQWTFKDTAGADVHIRAEGGYWELEL